MPSRFRSYKQRPMSCKVLYILYTQCNYCVKNKLSGDIGMSVSQFLFQYFRQDYCRYEKDMLDNLEHSRNIESCQWACQINPMCNYFTFSKDKNVCILHRMDVRHRKCDIIHGPPVPSLQSCLNDNAIPWASSSGDNLHEHNAIYIA